ncbi:ROK family transcriptional regulator [Clostridium liquoris]|nr:ROK family protein [Clostridium liquoris]
MQLIKKHRRQGKDMVRATPELLKEMNKKTILSLIGKQKIISRAEISNITHLSKATVSSIVEELLKENIILEQGEGVSTKQGGRKPINLVFNPSAGYIVSIDIGAYKCLMAICDLCGNILFKNSIIVKQSEDTLNKIMKAVKELIEGSGLKHKIIGIGMGIPGITDIENGVAISVPELSWKNIQIKNIFEKEFGTRVYLDNDVNMALLGEKWLGNATRYKNFVFINIGYGIGGGIMINNKIYRGSNYTAGEFGYLVLTNEALNMKRFTLDEYGYLESVASGSAIEKRMHSSSKEIFEKANNGDPRAQSVLCEMIDNLSMGISNIISILNPEAVIIGGGVSKAGNQLLLPLKEKIYRLSPFKSNIELSLLGDEAGVIGCAATVLTNECSINL